MKRKKMFALVEAWRESGQSIKAFLADKDVKPATFNYGRQKYRRENTIRRLALGRKNYLFARSHQAAQRVTMLYSLFCQLPSQ